MLPVGPAFDTMLGVPPDRDNWQKTFGSLIRDADSATLRQPAGYLFRQLPDVGGPDADGVSSYAAVLVRELDRWGIEGGLVPVTLLPDDPGHALVAAHPDRLCGSYAVDPNDGPAGIAGLRRAVAHEGIRAATCFPCGTDPPVAIDDPRMYPLYAACSDLDLPLFINAGVPGPRVPAYPQEVRRLDDVCYDFPDLVLVTRHGCEPWVDLAVKLMLKWPGLHYSTSAFAPKHYPAEIIAYANSRGAEKVLYAGYYPYGLTLERIFTELPGVPFRDHVWPRFLRDNARRVLHLDQ